MVNGVQTCALRSYHNKEFLDYLDHEHHAVINLMTKNEKVSYEEIKKYLSVPLEKSTVKKTFALITLKMPHKHSWKTARQPPTIILLPSMPKPKRGKILSCTKYN